MPESSVNNNHEDEDGIKLTEQLPAEIPSAHEILEGEEIFNNINIFKLQLNKEEKILLNNMIDEKSRLEIAEESNINMNTLDTHIRRLRIKFFSLLKEKGYEYQMFKKFDKSD